VWVRPTIGLLEAGAPSVTKVLEAGCRHHLVVGSPVVDEHRFGQRR
jgi:hypothetical protein